MLKKIGLLVIYLSVLSGVFAAEVHWTQRLEGSAVNGGFLQVQDMNLPQYYSGTMKDITPESYLRLGFRELNQNMFHNGKRLLFKVKVQITTYNPNGTVIGSNLQTLEATYDPQGSAATIDVADYRMPGIYKFMTHVQQVEILDIDNNNSSYIGTFPNYIYLEGGFKCERYYALNLQQQPAIRRNHLIFNADGSLSSSSVYNVAVATTVGSTVKEIELSWDYVQGAEYYDLEWTWVDNYSESGLSSERPVTQIGMSEADFRRNSTRIRTGANSYRIPQIYGKGYLIYRVRGVGRWFTAVSKDNYGRWSSGTGTKTTVNDWPHKAKIINEHEQKLNWQYQSTYAESGKKKEIVQYFDGSLRNRQIMTRVNSDNQAVVGETIYDNEGRGAIQILPVPLSDPTFRYSPLLNNGAASVPYNHLNFDIETTAAGCTRNTPDPLVSSSGSGRYYSTAAHTTDTDWHRTVPDAKGYPFTQIEYTPDNTGRVRTQGGLGETHQVGTGKETKFYYLQPSQEELNRLFGYKAGDKKHYKKNMEVDANGQVSVSYLDPQGRVIATALAGESPASLEALSSASGPGHTVLTTDLLNKLNQAAADTPLDDNVPYTTGRFGAVNDGLLLNTQLGVIQNNALYSFKYTAASGHYVSPGCEGTQNLSFPFVYDLKLSLRDDCGNEKISVSYPQRIGTQAIGSVNGDNKTIQFPDISLQQGSYTLFKEISINEAALNAYAEAYLDETLNPCMLDTSDFVSDLSTDCNTSCEECALGLGTLSEFLDGQRTSLGLQNLTPAQITEYTNLYNSLIESCMEPCKEYTMCDAYEGMMRSDLRPSGQYGSVNFSSPSDMELSVYNLSNGLGTNKNWRNPVTPYLEESGNPAYITVQYNGSSYSPPLVSGAVTNPVVTAGIEQEVKARPQDLANVGDFVSFWRDSWSSSLLPYHPEYKLLEYQSEICTGTILVGNKQMSSDAFDAFYRDHVKTYMQAKGTNSLSVNLIGSSNALMYIDPYFNQSYPLQAALGTGTLRNDLMREALEVNYEGKGMNMLAFAVRTAICGTDLSNSCAVSPSITWAQVEQNYTAVQRDAIWEQYKFNYLAFKQKINQILMDYRGYSQGFYNHCIGAGDFAGGIFSSFSYSSYFPIIVTKLYQYLGLGSIPPSLPIGLCDSRYDSKQIRMIRVDNLYDSSLPQAAAIGEVSDQAGFAQWQQTGLCPLAVSMERMLDQLGKSGRMLSVVNSNQLPELTLELYKHLTGVNVNNVPVTISGNVSGNNLQLSIGNILGSCTVSMEQVGALPWSTYGSAWHIWGIYHSYPVPGTNMVKVIVKAGATAATAREYVVTYTSCQPLDNCRSEYTERNIQGSDCQKEKEFEGALLRLVRQLHQDGFLHTDRSLANYPAYTGSVLPDYFGTSASWNGTNASGPRISSNGMEFYFNINFPSNTAFINSLSVVGNTIYVSFLKGNSANMLLDRLSAVYSYQLNKVSMQLDFRCPCDKEISIPVVAMNLFNGLLSKPIVPNGYQTQEIRLLAPYLSIKEPAIFNFRNDLTGLSFSLSDRNPCDIIIGASAGQTFSAAIAAISDVEFNTSLTSFSAVARFSNPQIAPMIVVGSNGCVSPLPPDFDPIVITYCDSCEVYPEFPISCNDAYTAYISGTTSITDPEFIPVNEQAFCESQYAYISTAYLAYLTAFNITSIHNPLYLSLAEFGSTPAGYSNPKLNALVIDYKNYYQSASGTKHTWNEFITPDYLLYNNICPAVTPPVYFPDTTIIYPCDMWENAVNTVNAHNQIAIYRQQLKDAFIHAYIEKAMATIVETFTESHPDKEYHYTLYYYNRAGNLIQTVPPKGAERLVANAADHQQINLVRATLPGETQNMIGGVKRAPEHTLGTVYHYNSLNQLVYQKTPDGGETRFAYDPLGRIVTSQNAKQKTSNAFSYTIYDPLGRVKEAGEYTASQSMQINDIGRLIRTASPTIEVDVISDGWISGVTTNANRREVTISVYDDITDLRIPSDLFFSPASNSFTDYSKGNSRNRIVATLYQKVYNANFLRTYDAMTAYDYDIHGNVKELIQVNTHTALKGRNHHVKSMMYDYDLVSGNVKEIIYQKGQKDQFIHRYTYDADNRITHVETSGNAVHFEKDAKYFYYGHGPLARTEIGEKKVQGQDYAYTIHGWLKTINGEHLNNSVMLGAEGYSGINSQGARDAYGFTLSYYEGDYTSSKMSMLGYSSDGQNMGANLYNGNIRAMVTAISNDKNQSIGSHKTNYTYDQLHRLRSMTGYSGWNNSPSGYGESMTYDANGNIQTLQRKRSSGSAPVMDELTYQYNTNTNQLNHVTDASGYYSPTYNDIESQSSGNYTYDAIGQLTKDEKAKISEIKWTVSGKVKEILFKPGHANSKITFDYDAMGHRVAKHVTSPASVTESTFYVLDAQGNTMSVYTFVSNQNKLYLSERMIYGSSRVGIEERHLEMKNPFELEPNPSNPVVFQDFNDGGTSWGFTSTVVGSCGRSSSKVNIDGKLKVMDACETHHSLTIAVEEGEEYELSMDLDISQAPGFYLEYISQNNSCGSVLKQAEMEVNENGTFSFRFTALSNCSKIVLKNKGKNGIFGPFIVDNIIVKRPISIPFPFIQQPAYSVSETSGDKRYELANHLGNVLDVVTDKKLPQSSIESVYSNDFSENTTGFSTWTNASLVLENGRMKVTTTQQYAQATLQYTTEPGMVYRLKFTADLAGQGGITAAAYDNPSATFISHYPISTNGTYYMDFMASSANTQIFIETAVGGTRIFYLDNVSLEKRPSVYANDLATTFGQMAAYGTAVTLSTENRRLKASGLKQWEGVKCVIATVPGKKYRVNYTLDLAGGGSVTPYTRDNATMANISVQSHAANGRYYMDFIATGTQTIFGVENPSVGPRTLYLSYVYVHAEDASVAFYYPQVVSWSDYYPFGMQMPGRNGNTPEYRYGFQGQEKDDEVKGAGNSYTTEFRQYDPRIGRWLSIDPLASKAPDWSPYRAFFDNPIVYTDPNGLYETKREAKKAQKEAKQSGLNTGEIYGKKGDYVFNANTDNDYWTFKNTTDFSNYTQTTASQEKSTLEQFKIGMSTVGTLNDLTTFAWDKTSNQKKWKISHDVHKQLKSSGYNVKTSTLKHGTAKALKQTSKYLGAAGAVVTVGEVIYNGEVKASNVLDATMTGVAFIPVVGWIASGLYFVADIVTEEVTGKSIGGHLDGTIDNKYGTKNGVLIDF